jgi:hypothetical protein
VRHNLKIRARKTNRNTLYDLEDFLLKEFSKDKENWIPDQELSCNDCQLKEDLTNSIDSPKSFLVKFKADNTTDPMAIKADTSGFILPKGLNYQFQESKSFFKSVSKNHCNLKISGEELRKIGVFLYEDQTNHINFPKSEVKKYLQSAYTQKDWQILFSHSEKTRWHNYMGKILKEKLVEDYGKIDQESISQAIAIDENGFLARIRDISKYNGFNENERNILKLDL